MYKSERIGNAAVTFFIPGTEGAETKIKPARQKFFIELVALRFGAIFGGFNYLSRGCNTGGWVADSGGLITENTVPLSSVAELTAENWTEVLKLAEHVCTALAQYCVAVQVIPLSADCPIPGGLYLVSADNGE